MDPIDLLPGLQARDLYERARVERALTDARERGRSAASKPPAAPAGAPSASRVRPGPIDRQSRLYKAAQDFEAIFVKQMLDAMRQTVDKTGLIEGGMAENIFEDMLYDQYAQKMARTAGFGLADQIYRQLAGKGTAAK